MVHMCILICVIVGYKHIICMSRLTQAGIKLQAEAREMKKQSCLV